MRTYNKKSILQKICTLFYAVSALVLFSCSALTDIETVKDSDGELVQIKIAVTGEARTAYPVLTEGSFAEYILKCDGVNKGWWPKKDKFSAYEIMNSDPVYVTKGTHTFVLSGKEENGAKYSATITKNIMQSEELAFALKFEGVSVEGTGTLKIDVTYPTENLSKIVVKRYDSADERTYKTEASVEKTTTVTSSLSGTYSYTEGGASIPAGVYIVEFNFYGADDILLCDPWPELVYISKGLQSVSSIPIQSYDDIYTINYDAASLGDAVFTRKPLRYIWRSEITLPTADEVSRTGYTFEGWYLSCDGDGNPTGEPVTGWGEAERSGNVTLYAKWTPHTNTIKYYTNLATDGALGEPLATQTAVSGTKLTAPVTEPSRTGYTFAGWTVSADDAVFDFENTPAAGDMNFYALWSSNVTFDANADDATGEMTAQAFVTSWLGPGTKALTANAYTRTGFTFLGWAEADDASEATYANAAVASFGESKTLYAVWHDNTQGYVITFVTNGGTPVPSQHVEVGDKVVKPDNCTKEGYVFAGWYTSSSLSVYYNFSTTVSSSSSKTLYAKWIQGVYYVTAGAGSNGNGTKEKPFSTVTQAVNMISSAGGGGPDADYVIVVSGEIKENVSITSNLSTARAKSITIRGLNGSDTDKLDGSSGGIVLNVGTAVPIILSDITITNGYQTNTNNTYGSGVKINSGASLTMKSGTVISGNMTRVYRSANVSGSFGAFAYGGGVYNAGTFIMEDGSITGNTVYAYARNSNSSYQYASASGYAYGGGVYNNGIFIMKGGTISGNSVTSESSSYKYGVTSSHSYGGGVHNEANASFTMEGGVIEDNTLSTTKDSTEKKGGAVYVASSCTFNMSGDARIPYGGGEGINDVFLENNTFVNVKDTLTAETPVATITPANFTAGTAVLTVADGVDLADEAPKFVLSNLGWYITGEGELASRTVYAVTYKDMGNAEFTGSTAGLPVSYVPGGTTVLSTPIKTHYTFAGWYLTSDCTGEAVTELTDENCTEAITLYAKWTESSYFTITYKDAGGADYSGTNLSSLPSMFYAGDTIILVAAVKSGYLFDAWYLESDCSGSAVTKLTDANCTANITIYAKWKPDYSIIYKDAGGADFSGTLADGTPTQHKYGTATTLKEPSKTGSVFLGWYIDWYERDGKYYGIGNSLTTLSATGYKDAITLYALWKEETTTVEIGTHTFDITLDTESYMLTATEGYTGYTWFVDGDVVTAGDSVWSISEDGTVLTYSAGNLIQGYVYTVKVRAYDENGVLFEKTKTLTR